MENIIASKSGYKFIATQLLREKQSGWALLVIISVLYCLLTFIADSLVFTDQFYHRSFSDQLNLNSIEALLEIRAKTWWLTYAMQPVIILIKATFVAVCISTGIILLDIPVDFRMVFKICLLSEGVFFMGQAVYVANLYHNLDSFTLDIIANFYPLSMLSYWGVENVATWLHYPLQIINIFELLFIICISWMLSLQWSLNFIESLNIVLPSYGTGLLLWLVLVTFLTLQIS
ncbi:MAG: hypothetical protein WD266_13450 [Balneolales bacterium]